VPFLLINTLPFRVLPLEDSDILLSGWFQAPDIKRIQREQGCLLVRQSKGDHEICFSPITDRHFPVDSKKFLIRIRSGIEEFPFGCTNSKR
jgi:hypothetical protein